MNGADLSRTLARLNHVFIPATKEGRDRTRRNPLVRAAAPVMWIYKGLTDTGRWLAVLSILVGAAALDVTTSEAYVLWCLLAGLLLGGFLLRPFYRLDRVHLDVDGPRQVTIGEEVSFRLTLDNPTGREFALLNIDRPLLPWDGAWREAPPVVDLLPARDHARVTTRARFTERGHHHLDAFHAAVMLPFGITQGRRIDSRGFHFVVVPRIARVDRIRLPERSRYQHGGVALASTTGESMELLGVRPYRHGDAVRDLHARSWARRGEPVVREYQQEYFSRVGVVLDTDLAAAGEAQLEAGISLAAGVIACLGRGETLIDLLVTGDRLHRFTLGRSLGHLEQGLDHLACVKPGPALDARQLAHLLAPFLDRLSCVVFIALHWDGARAALADEIRTRGAACKPLLVAPDTDATGAPGITVLRCAEIQSSPGLVL